MLALPVFTGTPGPSRISEKMRPSGKPEKANLGYGMAKRYLENKIKIAAKK